MNKIAKRMNKMADEERQWYSVELTQEEAPILRKELIEQDLKYDSSGAYNLVHFEVYMTEKERELLDDFIDENFY